MWLLRSQRQNLGRMAGSRLTRLEFDRLSVAHDTDGRDSISVLDQGKTIRLSRRQTPLDGHRYWVGTAAQALTLLRSLPDGAGIHAAAQVLGL